MNNCINPPHCGCPARYHGDETEGGIPTQRQPSGDSTTL